MAAVLCRRRWRAFSTASSIATTVSSSSASCGTMSEWLVVGGGPCGVVATGLIVDHLHATGAAAPGAVTFADENGFRSLGRFGRYKAVPGNTPVGIITGVLGSIRSISFAQDQEKRRSTAGTYRDSIQGAATLLTCPDPSATCDLRLAIEALEDASQRLRSLPSVAARCGRVATLALVEDSELGQHWRAELEQPSASSGNNGEKGAAALGSAPPSSFLRARRVLLCPGRVPSATPPGLAVCDEENANIQLLSVEDAVCPRRCGRAVEGLLKRSSSSSSSLKFAVVGNSHSGMLVALNLVRHAGVRPEDVTVIHKEPLRFAEPREGGTWTKYDGTGLKGTVREWALEGEAEGSTSEAARLRRQLFVEGEDWRSQLERVRGGDEDATVAVAFAHGFDLKGAALPGVTTLGHGAYGDMGGGRVQAALFPGRCEHPEVYDGFTGRLHLPALPADCEHGLYGAGFGFPEVWTDPEGHTEARVGFNVVYVKHVKRIIARGDTKQQQQQCGS